MYIYNQSPMCRSKQTYRFIALSLAVILFSATVGFSLDLHYCQGKVKSFSVFGSAKGCDEIAAAEMTCAHHEAVASEDDRLMFSRPPCCESARLLLQSVQECVTAQTAAPADDVRHIQVTPLPDLFAPFKPSKLQLLPKPEKYKPPPLHRNTPVYIQNFRF